MAHAESEMEGRALILFLCTGNYYRSRFAELLFNAQALAKSLPWHADSAGLAPECFSENPGEIAPATVHALRVLGIAVPTPTRLPRAVTETDLERADRVIAMKEAEHRPLLRVRYAAFEHKVEYWSVHDVDAAPTSEMLPLIETHVLELVATLAAARARRG